MNSPTTEITMRLSPAQVRALKTANEDGEVFEGSGNRFDTLLVLERKGALELLRTERYTITKRTGLFGRGYYNTREYSENIYKITDAGRAAAQA